MSDVDRLLAAFDSGELLRPSAEIPNIVDLANAVAGLGGGNGVTSTPNARAIAENIGPAEHLVVVAADGLGMNIVRAMAPGSFLPGHVAQELLTVFPSSTPVVFTSFATGQWPSVHGVPSWHVYLSEIDAVATIIHFVRRSDEKSLSELGVDRAQAYPLPSRSWDHDREALSVVPEGILDSAFSTYSAAGGPQRGYQTLHEAINMTVERVSKADGPTYTFVYYPAVDMVTHQYGTEHENVAKVVAELDHELSRLRSSLPWNARLIVTADHGLLDSDGATTYEITPTDDLVQYLVREPWGVERCVQFEVKRGKESGFERAFRERFGDSFYLMKTEDVERLELYGPGPIGHLTRRRLGTHVAISSGPAVMAYFRPDGSDEGPPKVSTHSGLAPDEMLVPLVIA